MKWLNCEKTKVLLFVFVAVILFGTVRAEADFVIGEPTNLGPPVNSTSAEAFDCLSADGLEIYLDRTDQSTHWLWDIWVAKRPTIDDDWGDPVKLGSNINTPDHDECYASISADGLELYFCCGDIDTDCDLYVASRETTEDEWLPAVSLGEVVNSSAIEEGVRISTDGLSLYFCSDRSGGEGGKDLYVTTRQGKNQAWSTPVNIGPLVNSSSDDFAPSISSDGLALIFSSNRPGKYSSEDLPDLWFTTRRTNSDPWQEPINLGPMINTDDVDSAGISLDGLTLYLSCYVRDWGYGFYDIWQAPIIPIVDFNGDGFVDILELVILVNNWGTDNTLCDIGPMPFGNGIVDDEDLFELISYWGDDIDDPTLMANYKLDEAEGDIAYDSAGILDGILNGNPTWQPSGGIIDGALELDGIDDYISTPFVLNPAEGPFSVFAWIKGGAPGQTIISQVDGQNWLSVDAAEGKLVSELYSGRSAEPLVSDVVITDGQWHRVGFTWDGVNRILYVDDMIAAIEAQNALPGSEGGLYIGAGRGTCFCGMIDDVRIYSRAITP